MNQSQLEENYFFACLKYAVDNGGVSNYDTFLPNECELSSTGISKWTHSSPQPTNNDLLAYSLADLDEVKLVWNCIQKVKEGK